MAFKAKLTTVPGSGDAVSGVTAGDNAESGVEFVAFMKSHAFQAGDQEQGWENQCSVIAPDGLRHCGGRREDHTTPAPNIKFIGRPTYDKGKRKILKDPQPVTSFRERKTIVLPSAEFQITRRVFYHEHAGLIIRHYPHLYKRVIRKG